MDPSDIDLVSPAASRTVIPGSSTHGSEPRAVFRHPYPEGEDFWALTKYEDIRMVSRQPRLFSSYAKGTMVGDPDEMGLSSRPAR